MIRSTVLFLLCAFLACTPFVRAQRQTGAAAGIAVPVPPDEAQHGSGGPQVTASAIFRVRLLDGRNGDPLRNAHLTLWYDEQEGAGTLLTTDMQGNAAMPAPLGQPMRVLVRVSDLADCRKDSAREVSAGFNLQAIAQHGESAGNRCGAVGKHPAPGELVVFARPLRWYEGINQGSASH